MIERLRAAGRHDEVAAWMDRAVESGRFQHRGNDYWLDAAEIADEYLRRSRTDDGIDVLRRDFRSRPGNVAFQTLLSRAETSGREDEERGWALDTARALARQPYGTGAPLIEIALAEGDLGAAGEAERQFGAGAMWERLIDASRETRPREAAYLYRPQIEADLEPANTRVYPKIAKNLVKVRALYAKADTETEFEAYMAKIRSDYARRPSLMAALDKKGL